MRAAAVITCSDAKAVDPAQDTSGPLAVALLGDLGLQVAPAVVVPDDTGAITAAIDAALASGARVVVCTGGTGLGPRDVTPEAIAALGGRVIPGVGEAIRAHDRGRVPTADLSRGGAWLLDGAVVLALPGSPGGVRDGLRVAGPLLHHALDMIAGGGHSPAGSGVTSGEHAHGSHAVGSGVTSGAHAHGSRSADGSSGGHGFTSGDHAHGSHAAVGSGVASGGNPAAGSGFTHGGHADGSGAAGLVGDAPIEPAVLAAEVTRRDAGAVVTFEGRVRDHDEGRTVTALHYEAHPDAAAVLADLLTEARARPEVLAATARHRTGPLAIGDLAFAVAVAAAHRGEAFTACAWLVDTAKERLPIWKHQTFADGGSEWVHCP